MSEYVCCFVPQELEDNSRQNYQVSAKFSQILFCSVLFELFANATQNRQTASFVVELGIIFILVSTIFSVCEIVDCLDNFLSAELASATRFLNLCRIFQIFTLHLALKMF